jgi:hypothetical protein
MAELSQTIVYPDSANDTKQFFNKYFTESISYPSNQVDAVVGFFKKRGFDEVAAASVAAVLLEQAKIDNVNVFTLLDTLKGLENRQLSSVIARILNSNRSRVSSIGYRNTDKKVPYDVRNIRV